MWLAEAWYITQKSNSCWFVAAWWIYIAEKINFTLSVVGRLIISFLVYFFTWFLPSLNYSSSLFFSDNQLQRVTHLTCQNAVGLDSKDTFIYFKWITFYLNDFELEILNDICVSYYLSGLKIWGVLLRLKLGIIS